MTASVGPLEPELAGQIRHTLGYCLYTGLNDEECTHEESDAEAESEIRAITQLILIREDEARADELSKAISVIENHYTDDKPDAMLDTLHNRLQNLVDRTSNVSKRPTFKFTEADPEITRLVDEHTEELFDAPEESQHEKI